MSQNILLKSLQMGDVHLNNRICMAALTRTRCFDDKLIPNQLHVDYYTQRAAAGFILSESTQISNRSNTSPRSCGIFTNEQVEGWKRVTASVKEKGGIIFNQIWHGGRTTHSSLQNGLEIWGPSPIAIRGTNPCAKQPQEVPHEMTLDEIKEVIDQFRIGAENCKKAGFDGIELHGSNGYLVDSFLRQSANQRKDYYGGSVENRSRFCLEVIDQLIDVYGKGRVGIKLSPVGRYNDMFDSDPLSLYTHLIKELEKRKIAFIEMKDVNEQENEYNFGYPSSKSQIKDIFDAFKPLFSGVMIANNQYTPQSAIEGIEKGKFDAVTFGRLFISNPDLVERIRNEVSLNYNWDQKTFYEGGARGYTDYPLYHEWIKTQK